MILKDNNKYPFTKGCSILFRENGEDLSVFEEKVLAIAEEYKDADVLSIRIRIFLDGIKEGPELSLSDEAVLNRICDSLFWDSSPKSFYPMIKVGNSPKGRYKNYITAINRSKIKSCRGFIVADTETLLEKRDDADSIEGNRVHIPYLIGFLVVRPGDDLSSLISSKKNISSFFSEEYFEFHYPSFEERSSQMMKSFLNRLAQVCQKNPSINTVYFHNFAVFYY